MKMTKIEQKVRETAIISKEDKVLMNDTNSSKGFVKFSNPFDVLFVSNAANRSYVSI
jgi:hypothetical protein